MCSWHRGSPITVVKAFNRILLPALKPYHRLVDRPKLLLMAFDDFDTFDC